MRKKRFAFDLTKRVKKRVRRMLGIQRPKTPGAFSAAKIHKNDFIYRFIKKNSNSRDEAISRYLEWGKSSAHTLKGVLVEANFGDVKSLLDFASGYGCVARHLTSVFPSAKITACDIHPEAIRFMTEHFDVDCVLSTPVPEALRFDQPFDVVVAFSFFSHMPKSTWVRWLKALIAQARPGGVIVFTTHGYASWNLMRNPPFEEDGFWFKPKSEQKDLNGAEYGTTITTPEFVRAQLGLIPDVDLIFFKEGFWGHQDAYVLK